jgi:hypothetical protein
MSAQQNAGEFIDSDFEPGRASAAPVPPAGVNMANRPPTREEIEALVSEKQIKLAELKRAQEELERERSGLEELRRRQVEFQTGRAEILQQLTRGVGLLEEAEMNLRRESDEMARALAGFREATQKVQAINEQAWTTENHTVELTRASTTVENARMEWNAARLRFPLLSSASSAEADTGVTPNRSVFPPAEMDMRQLFKFGLALNWPLVLLGAGIIAALIWRR